MSGYSLETRQRVARSPRWLAMAPALTQEQQRRLAPTIIVKRPAVADERQRRFDDPTIFDLADLTPLRRWQRHHTETLREPLPGSGIVVAGECSMPWMQYVRAAVTNQVPAPLRVRVGHKLNELTIAPCENHLMVPLGYESMSYREILRTFTEHRHKYVAQADHLHEVSVKLVEAGADAKYEWTCKLCGQSGFEHYTAETLGHATGVVWHGCRECSRPDFVSRHSREWFNSLGDWGIAAQRGYKAWATEGRITRRNFLSILGIASTLVAVPYVPPAYGAPQTYFVDWVSGNDSTGTGASGAPWKKYDKARTSMTTNNGDTVKGRGDTSSPKQYDERWNYTAPWKFGTSFALATVVTKDTGHTPTIASSTLANGLDCALTMAGSEQQYVVFDSIYWEANSRANSQLIRMYSTLDTAASAAHHIRFNGCTYHTAQWADSEYTRAHHCENLNPSASGSASAPVRVYLMYFSGKDNLLESATATDLSGNLVHSFAHGVGENDITDRSVIRYSKAFTMPWGILVGCGADMLCYYNLVYNISEAQTALRISGFPTDRAGIYNNTVTGCAAGGIYINTNGNLTKLRNNLSVNNTGPGNYTNTGTNTDTTGTTNSWQISGFSADFVNSAANNYHLGTNSSAIAAGADVSSLLNAGTFPVSSPRDYDNVSVPQNSTWDVGALERVDPPTTPGAGVGGSNPSPWRRGRIRR